MASMRSVYYDLVLRTTIRICRHSRTFLNLIQLTTIRGLVQMTILNTRRDRSEREMRDLLASAELKIARTSCAVGIDMLETLIQAVQEYDENAYNYSSSTIFPVQQERTLVIGFSDR